MNETVRTQPKSEEKIMAAIAHGSIIGGMMGLPVAAIIWVTQKEKSAYVGFQALQALAYQLVGTLGSILCWACWGGCYFLSFIPIMASPERYSDAPPPLFFVSLASMLIPMALMGLWWLYGLIAGALTLTGHDFRYLILGQQLERYLVTCE